MLLFVRKRRPWRVIFLVTLFTIAVGHGARTGQTQVAEPPLDLSGKWVLDTGETIEISHLAASGKVIASFSPSVPCHNDRRTELLNSFLKVSPVSGGGSEFTLTDGPFFACTRDKKLIDDCDVSAVWKSKFRYGKISPGGGVITGERFHEYLAYDIENGNYVNCSRKPSEDSWSSFRLTRVCEPDRAKRCRAISQIIQAFTQMLPPGMVQSPEEWNQSVARHGRSLPAALTKLRALYCDDEAMQARIDAMEARFQGVANARPATRAEVISQQRIVAGIDLELKEMATASCAPSGPSTPPPASGICPEGSPPKQPGDNEAIDQARKQIDDAIKEAMKMLQEYERDAAGGANTTAGKYADYWRTRIAQLKKLKGYWDMIRSASCIPRELVDLIRAMLGGRTDMCTDLCYETAKWIETWYPGPNGDIQKKMFLELCGFNCP
jgi:hypothetical protein